MQRLEQTARIIDRCNEGIGRAVSWLTLGMVVVTFLIVILRYLFNVGSIAVQEAVTYMHALVFMLGAAYTLKHDGHVRVDILYRCFGPRGQAWVDLVGTLLLLLPVAGFVLWVSWEYVATSWALREGSRQTGGLAGLYLLKTAIPALAVLLALQGLALTLRGVLVLRGHTEAAPQHDAPREI